jgi:hypothetical protein
MSSLLEAMMKPVLFSLCATIMLISTSAAAATVLDCQVSGDAGSGAFQFSYDEQSPQAMITWRSAPPGGNLANEVDFHPQISLAQIVSGFGANNASGSYLITIDRTNGAARLTLVASAPITSSGQCQRGAAAF